MRTPRNWLKAATAAIVICAGLVGVMYMYVVYAANRAAPTRPLVTITGTFPQETGVSGQPFVVFAQASDPDGIVHTDLWINGQQVASQTNADAESPHPFTTSQVWIPSGPGNYLVVLKAQDRIGFTGDSEPLIIQVTERQYWPGDTTSGEYILQEGDTIENIAADLGLNPEQIHELNPDLGEPAPGTTVDVPHVPETGDEDAGAALDPGADEIPRVDPPSPPPAPGEAATEAEPLSEDWWLRLPLPANFGCLLRPESCRTAIDAEAPPFPAPDSLGITHGRCFTVLSWQDNSENELGFRVYRFTMRPRFRYEMIALLAPSPGSGSWVSYNDALLPVGSFFYAVVAYNSGGQIWSEASEEVTNDCPLPNPGSNRALVIEGLQMDVEGGFDRLYCYASLNHSPFERVPFAASEFIRLDSGSWDIAEHFAGSNKRTVLVSGDLSLPVIVECMGWLGEDLVNLGRFERHHPPEEWDGRMLIGSPAGGQFSVGYRILPSFAAVDERRRADWPLIDPSAAPPYNVRESDHWYRCTRSPGLSDDCDRRNFEPGIAWDFDLAVAEDGSVPPHQGFKVYYRLEGMRVPRLYYTVLDRWPNTAPFFRAGCGGGDIYYSVSAVTSRDSLTGEEIQTPLSEEFRIPSCATLQITFRDLVVPRDTVRDGDLECDADARCQTYESYGWLSVNGQIIRWNNHCDPGAFGTCLGSVPSTTRVRDDGSYLWSEMALNTGTGWRRGNNVIRIPIESGEKLRISFEFWDHDSTSDDDKWCGKGFVWWPRHGGAETWEWTGVDERFSVGDYRCSVEFFVRALPPE